MRSLGLLASVAAVSAACGSDPSPADDRGARPSPARPTDPGAPSDPDSPPSPDAVQPVAGSASHAGVYRHFDINHVLSTGQSNSVANDAAPPLTAAQPYANLKFDSGVIPSRECDGDGCKVYAKPTAFVPLVEGDAFFDYGVETMSSGFANEASKLAKDQYLAGTSTPAHDILVSLHGRSGSTYRCLRKGGCPEQGAEAGYVRPFDQAMMEVSDAMALAKASGKTYVVRAVTALHGESDHHAYATHTEDFPMRATSGQGVVATYAEAMIEWQRDYEAGVRAITGQTLSVPFFMLQMSNWGDVPHSRIPTWQLEAHVKAPGRVVVVTPGYPIGYADDCLHFTNHQQRRIGEYFAKAYARVVLEGRPWEPLRPADVRVHGNVVIARFLVPRPPLVLDTERVNDPGNYGFEYTDDSGAPPAITNVAIVSADTVAITLSSAPTGNGRRLRYAFTAAPDACAGFTSGPRGNLRDSDATASNYGYDLYNWSVHFDVPVER